VPTTREISLRKHSAQVDASGDGVGPPPPRIRLVRFSTVSRGVFAPAARRISRIAGARHRTSETVCRRVSELHLRYRSCLPFLGRNFFPQVDGGQHAAACAGAGRMRIEETAGRFAEVEKAIREVIRVRVAAGRGPISAPIFRQLIRSTTTPAQSANRTATFRSHSIRACPDRRPTSVACARAAAPAFPGMSFSFSARRHRQPDPQFRSPGADRPAGPRQRSRCGLCLRQRAPGADPPCPGRCRCAHPAVGPAADHQRQYGPHARAVTGVTAADVTKQSGREPRELQPGGPHLLAQREERPSLIR